MSSRNAQLTILPQTIRLRAAGKQKPEIGTTHLYAGHEIPIADLDNALRNETILVELRVCTDPLLIRTVKRNGGTTETATDLTPILHDYGRRAALSVTGHWKAPAVVLRYLKTGDRKLRPDAREAARRVVKTRLAHFPHHGRSIEERASILAAYRATLTSPRWNVEAITNANEAVEADHYRRLMKNKFSHENRAFTMTIVEMAANAKPAKTA